VFASQHAAEQKLKADLEVYFMSPEHQSFGDELDRRLHDQLIITSVQSMASVFSVISLFAPLPIIRKVVKKKSTGTLQALSRTKVRMRIKPPKHAHGAHADRIHVPSSVCDRIHNC
jgi:hypothetical protein